jgi:putative nucleotidyltransferase with HDIG domain
MAKKLHTITQEKFSNKFMKKLFSRFQSLEGDFLYNHSFLTSVIALEVGRKFTWMTAENKEKIYLGAVLHDLGHKRKENALKEGATLQEINKLPSEDREDILNHPTKFANHLAQVESLHIDIIKIVKDHHGIHAENAFPRAVSPNEINLVFALFVLSHEFCMALYKVSFDQTEIHSILEELNQQFYKGNYKKILHEFTEAMSDVFIKEEAA